MTLHPGSLPVRTDDPDTSYAAALKVAMGASRERPVVLEPETPRASESGIRTRLVAEHAERGKSKFGNAAKRWVAVDRAAVPAAPPTQDPALGGLLAHAAASSAPSTEIGADDVVAFPSVGTDPLAQASSACRG